MDKKLGDAPTKKTPACSEPRRPGVLVNQIQIISLHIERHKLCTHQMWTTYSLFTTARRQCAIRSTRTVTIWNRQVLTSAYTHLDQWVSKSVNWQKVNDPDTVHTMRFQTTKIFIKITHARRKIWQCIPFLLFFFLLKQVHPTSVC